MIDKRSPHLGKSPSPSPKRAKTFPLAHNDETNKPDEVIRTFDRRSKTLDLEGETPPPEVGLVEAPERRSEGAPALSPQGSHGSNHTGEIETVSEPDSNLSFQGNSLETQGESISSTDDNNRDGEGTFHQPSPRLSEGDAEELSSIGDRERSCEEDDGSPVPGSPSSEIDLGEELGPWAPPPEPLRPPNPYKRGQELQIRKHRASPPFGGDYPDYPGIRDCANERDLRTKTLVELCLEHPPMAGETAWEDAPRNLHIVDEIRVRDDGGAQIVVCRLDDEPTEYAAKIYDPLYYGFSDRIWPDIPRDVADEADKDYCCEVAAYLEINDQFGGKEIPAYFGSWTFQVPLDLPDAQKMRDVRLILMEPIKGATMSEVDPGRYPEEVRLEALAQMLEAYSRITFAGVSHGDLAQRNVMVCDGEAAKTIDRVVLIDFNFAVVSRLDNFETLYGRRPKSADKPGNPINQWWGTGGLYSKFGGWFPASWKLQRRPLREWLYERWGKSQEFLPHKEPLDWTDE